MESGITLLEDKNDMRTRIKICGITRSEDALYAAEQGVDALGFVFSKSPRRIDADTARDLIWEIPPLVSVVGVFVDETDEIVKHIARRCRLNMLQFHGSEKPEYISTFNRKIIKAIRVQSEKDLEQISHYHVHAILLDTYVDGINGGTGKTFDWNLAIKAKQYGRVILSGGLNPDNVAEAIQKVKPFAVDVSSGVESEPGIKDHNKIKSFIEAVNKAG